jgi:YD repeat-containing protein
MQTDYQHNALNHWLTVTESGVAASSYGYDNQDNISRMTDALLKVRRKT